MSASAAVTAKKNIFPLESATVALLLSCVMARLVHANGKNNVWPLCLFSILKVIHRRQKLTRWFSWEIMKTLVLLVIKALLEAPLSQGAVCHILPCSELCDSQFYWKTLHSTLKILYKAIKRSDWKLPDILYSAGFFHLVKARLSSTSSRHTEMALIERHMEASSPTALQQSRKTAWNRESCPKHGSTNEVVEDACPHHISTTRGKQNIGLQQLKGESFGREVWGKCFPKSQILCMFLL